MKNHETANVLVKKSLNLYAIFTISRYERPPSLSIVNRFKLYMNRFYFHELFVILWPKTFSFLQ
jgi:hypothetical protein